MTLEILRATEFSNKKQFLKPVQGFVNVLKLQVFFPNIDLMRILCSLHKSKFQVPTTLPTVFRTPGRRLPGPTGELMGFI